MAGHEPVPTQLAASVATPLLQEGGRHCVVAPGNVQFAVTTPLQEPSQAVPSPAHGGREP
jgi:hypothetical protein